MEKENNLIYPQHNGELLDIENLIDISKKYNNCPYFNSKDASRNVDLILLPSNCSKNSLY